MSTIKVNALQDTSGNGYYPARAWVNFNGSGTVAIRANSNVSSITDNGTGDYTISFSSALSDADYATIGTGGDNTSDGFYLYRFTAPLLSSPTTSAVRSAVSNTSPSKVDAAYVNVNVVR
tara:strand:+ start:1790 stop:2149 length:360 start_codon:yes stop_codon:yes gene_type:complete